MSYIASIQVALPKYKHSQQSLAQFYCNVCDDDIIKRKIQIVSRRSGINSRYSVVSDFGKTYESFTFFAKSPDLLPVPSLTQRMSVYEPEALALAIEAVNKIPNIDSIKSSITHIITVTCTGLFAPGLDIGVTQSLGLNESIKRSSINFLGCNAAIIALKSADAFCRADANAKVLVVCTELCTLHFQKDFTDDYLLSNMLFGDGCAAVLVSNDKADNTYNKTLSIENFYAALVYAGKEGITWQLSEKGFIMNLASYISDLIKLNIKGMLKKNGVVLNNIHHWAIHPGGKKILDDFCSALDLEKNIMKESYDTLADYGNMSSATVLFVLKRIIESNENLNENDAILAAAFGPGLSIETMHLKYV
jgi:alpha-pyrone synthase